jgi:hypothetical protein
MSSNLFSYKFRNGQWYKADNISESDIAVIVDTSRGTIWFFEGSKSTARNRSNARGLLGDLKKNYLLYKFKRISNKSPSYVLEALENLKKQYFIKSGISLQFNVRKFIKYHFYFSSISNILLVVSLSFISLLISFSISVMVDSYQHYAMSRGNFLFFINFNSILLISSFVIFIISALIGIFLRTRILVIYSIFAGLSIFIPLFMLRIWDIILITEQVGQSIYIRTDVLSLFILNILILEIIGIVLGFFSLLGGFKKSKENEDSNFN